MKTAYKLTLLALIMGAASIFASRVSTAQKAVAPPATPPVVAATLADLKPLSTQKLPVNAQVDKVVVHKAKRVLSVYQKGVLLKQYPVSLGFNPVGHKQFEGDGRTPEGVYTLDWRNPKSLAYLSLHINYPNAQDVQYAKQHGHSAGGDVMVHGLWNTFKGLDPARIKADWTNGCVAVSNADMDELWRAVPDGTVIELLP
ncbi:MAG: L,D-transpeptidase family protein [Formosimonas sp.]